MYEISNLNNGLTLINNFVKRASSVSINLKIPSGVVYEDQNKLGLSAVLSEYLIKGSAGKSSKEILSELENEGIKYSISNTLDSINLNFKCLKDSFEKTIQILSKIILKPNFDESELGNIKDSLISYINLIKDNPTKQAFNGFREIVYDNPFNLYSDGKIETIKEIKLTDVRDFYNLSVKPVSSQMTITSSLNETELKSILEKNLDKWEGESFERKTPESLNFGINKFIPDTSEQSQIVFGYNGPNYNSKDFYTATIINQVLSGGMFGRIFIEVREKKGLAYSVTTNFQGLKNAGLLYTYCGTTNDRAKESVDTILAMFDNLAGSIDKKELSLAKNSYLSDLILSRETVSGTNTALSTSYWNYGLIREVDQIIEAVNTVSLEDVDLYFKKYPFENPTTLILGQKEISFKGNK